MLCNSDKDKFFKAHIGRNRGKKASKSVVKSKSGVGSNNGQGNCKSKISFIEKKVNNQKRQLLVFNTVSNPGSENEESD